MTLILVKNSLEGNIPESLGNLEMLTTLALKQNNLQGHVPHSITNLYSLKNLYIGFNELEGPFTSFNIQSFLYRIS